MNGTLFSSSDRPKQKPLQCYDLKMQIEHIVALLVAERNRLDTAIHALQGPVNPPGRPPKSAAAPISAEPRAPRKRTLSPAGRKAIADAARKRWAAIKAGKAPSPFAKSKRNTKS